jgi:hypothetical protein
MSAWRRGDLVELDGLLAVIVGLQDEPGVPEDHVALWLGEPQGERLSRGGSGGLRPVVYTVPTDYICPALKPDMRH